VEIKITDAVDVSKCERVKPLNSSMKLLYVASVKRV